MESTSTTTAPPAAAANPGRPIDILTEIAQGVGANGETLSLILDLQRRIIELLLPKATGDGPTLAELLAAILATQREMLIVTRSNADNLDEILQRLDALGISVPHGSLRPNGSRHA